MRRYVLLHKVSSQVELVVVAISKLCWCLSSSGVTEQDVFVTALVETELQTLETTALGSFTDKNLSN